MRNPTTQEIFTYWNTLREARPAPSRSQINPVAIPKVLPDIFLLDADKSGEHIFRLAGTRLCGLFGRELRGASFNALWNTFGEHKIGDLLKSVVEEHAAVVASAEGFSSQEHLCKLELILLPLRGTSQDGTRVVGCLSPSAVPMWFSVHTMVSMRLGNVRLCWPSGRRETSPAPPALVPARKIGRFMVYEGGGGPTIDTPF
jgi:hypothetical protein